MISSNFSLEEPSQCCYHPPSFLSNGMATCLIHLSKQWFSLVVHGYCWSFEGYCGLLLRWKFGLFSYQNELEFDLPPMFCWLELGFVLLLCFICCTDVLSWCKLASSSSTNQQSLRLEGLRSCYLSTETLEYAWKQGSDSWLQCQTIWHSSAVEQPWYFVRFPFSIEQR